MANELNIAEIIWQQLQAQINELSTRVDDLQQRSESSETGGGMVAFTYALAPRAADGGMQTDNLAYCDVVFISNGRKSGEGVGAGTGVPCYFDPAINDYRKFSDDLQVTV